MKLKKPFIVLFIILFLAAFLRFYKLGAVPFGLANDEAGIIYSAYSIFKTGRDSTGKFLPVSINLDNSFSPVYIYATAPFVGILGLSSFAGRLPFALLGIGSVGLLFFLVRKLFNNNLIALMSALVMAISPWHLHISRSAFDANFALFFYLLGIYLFIINTKKGNIILSLPAFFLAFYSYHATKIFFLFLIPFLIYFYWPEIASRKKEVVLFVVSCGFIFAFFFYVVKNQQGASRMKILLFNKGEIQKATQAVNWEREKNTAPFFLRGIFNNKPLYFLRLIRENYLEAFSPHYLFLYGDTHGLPFASPFYRGQMYIIELPLLALGLAFLLKIKDRRLKKLWLLLLLIAPLPSSFSSDKTYVFRSVMMLPILSAIVAAGIYYFWIRLKSKKLFSRYFLRFTFLLLYFFLFISYLYQYFCRYSVYGAEGWFRSSRELAEYLGDNQNSYENVYVSGAGPMFIFQHAIFNKLEPKIVQEAWKSPYPKKLDKITLLSNCLNKGLGNPMEFLPQKTLYVVGEGCHKDIPPDETIKDFGEPLRIIWKIYSAP